MFCGTNSSTFGKQISVHPTEAELVLVSKLGQNVETRFFFVVKIREILKKKTSVNPTEAELGLMVPRLARI